jgi:hypothetical protein
VNDAAIQAHILGELLHWAAAALGLALAGVGAWALLRRWRR